MKRKRNHNFCRVETSFKFDHFQLTKSTQPFPSDTIILDPDNILCLKMTI